MAVNVITYTYDVASKRVFVLVDDGSKNLQIYVGDISGFNQNSTNASPLKWSKYIRQPLGFPVDVDGIYELDIRYAANAIYLRDLNKGIVTKLPESSNQQVSTIRLVAYTGDPNIMYKIDDFQVFSDGSFYYGIVGGVFYVDARGVVELFVSLSTQLDDFPTLIKGNAQIVIAVFEGENGAVYVSRVRDKDTPNKKKWHKIGLEYPGKVFGIFIDEANSIANLVTAPTNLDEGVDGTYNFKMNRFSFDKFLIDPAQYPLERLDIVDLNARVAFTGVVSDWIDAIQIDNGVRIGFIDRTNEGSPVSRSVVLTSKGNTGKYDISYEAENLIKVDLNLENKYKSLPIMGLPSNYCAFFLDFSGYFYIAPGGITKAFQQIEIEKLS